MNIFTRRRNTEATTAQSATASVADEQGKHAHDDVAAQIDALEGHAENDPAMRAAAALETYELTPGAKSLLDRALDNLAQNDGTQVEDPEFKLTVQSRSALINAAGNDLSIAISAVVDSCDNDMKAAGSIIYSLCYNALKGALFIANLDYRRYLDPRADFDLTPYGVPPVAERSVESEALGAGSDDFETDRRSEEREPPIGLEATIDREWEFYRSIYGSSVEITDDVFAASLDDLRIYLQLTVEAFGWDAERPMAFANIAEKNGTFTPITDARQALDHAEITRQLRRRERQAKDNSRMLAAAERAKAALAKAGQRNAK